MAGIYTFNELADMHLIYGEAQGSSRAAVRSAERFPNRRILNRNVFPNLDGRLREFGNCRPLDADRGRPAAVNAVARDEQILEMVAADPTLSVREIAPNFSRNGVLNLRNMYYWSVENPHVTRIINQKQPFSLNVWTGMFQNSLVGPFFLPNLLTGNDYLIFLVTELEDFFDGLPLQQRFNMWYMQNGALPHTQGNVVEYLNNVFPERWIGRNGPIPWPPRSMDLTPLDFYFWGHVKSIVIMFQMYTNYEIESSRRWIKYEIIQKYLQMLEHRY
ncbi:hypothetical protein TcasGA2_TC000005 [Tribolium castaneum]|uniref:DUF4817 domain-containing protein n=1 Tax=Tribolium castaneum TaxID=7070 RepID=D7EKQ1_TRICA|nr:hypothetical protein TcasGA2_TC000005 [Tribolium castaneum]